MIISQGLPHILKTESSLGRLLLSSLSWKCNYFLRITTQFASLPFCCVALVDANLTEMSLSPKDYHTFWTPSRHWGAVCFHQCHVRVAVSVGWLHNVQADVLTRSAACCQLNKTVFISYGLPHTVKTESSLMRLCFPYKSYAVLCSMPVGFRKLWLRPATFLWSIRLCMCFVMAEMYGSKKLVCSSRCLFSPL